jgi:SAM-dependent methyltransferase
VRFLRRLEIPLVRGTAFALPFKNNTFDCVISSQVIEHIPYDDVLFTEMSRVLRPGGRLIIGTPDYSTVGWQLIEPLYGLMAPGGYYDEHITHYSRESLLEILVRNKFVHEETDYVAQSELMMLFRKRGAEPQKTTTTAEDLGGAFQPSKAAAGAGGRD